MSQNKTLSSPKGLLEPVTPSNTEDLPLGVCDAVNCETGGTIDLIDEAGKERTSYPLQPGYNPIRVRRIKVTNNNATNIWALYNSDR